jgi:hypothetical protein
MADSERFVARASRRAASTVVSTIQWNRDLRERSAPRQATRAEAPGHIVIG